MTASPTWFLLHPDAARFAHDTYTTYPGPQKRGVWQHIHPQLVERWNYPGTQDACRMHLMGQWRTPRKAPDSQSGNISTQSGNVGAEANSRVSPIGHKALSEQDMVALFQVDTARWEVVKLTHNQWATGAKGPDGEPVVTPLYQTTIHLRLRPGAEGLETLATRLLANLSTAYCPTIPLTEGPVPLRRHLLEVDPFDLHLGKKGWGEETESADYDIGIACRDFRAAFDDLLRKTSGFEFEVALLAVANDLLHTDNLRSETTAGTRVDSDSRYHKMFDVAVGEMVWAVRRLLEVARTVHVVVPPGNHDKLGAFLLMRVVEAIFANEPRVTFDNAAPLRKYYQWGRTLWGFTHGSEEKAADLPLIMAQERPQEWAATVFRLWRTGHLHKSRQTRYVAGDSFTGVEVRVMRSLSGTDAWHYSRGYVKERRAVEAFVHDSHDGQVAAFVSKLPEESFNA